MGEEVGGKRLGRRRQGERDRGEEVGERRPVKGGREGER